MAKAPSASNGVDNEIRTQKFRVDFYRVQNGDLGRIEFQNALIGAMKERGANRSREVYGERIDLYDCNRSASTIEGEVGRVRMNDTPAIANQDCTVSEIPLEDDQGIAERTAFLYDSGLGVLALHSKREAVSASRIAGFCSFFKGRDVAPFSLDPILRRDAEQKFRSMQKIRKIEVEYAKETRSTISYPDSSTRSFVRGLTDLAGETLSITVSAGRKRSNTLSLENARAMIRTALNGKREAVKKLKISGTGAGDEILLIDLLEDRLRASTLINFRGRVPSYEQRRIAVRKLYSDNSAEIR